MYMERPFVPGTSRYRWAATCISPGTACFNWITVSRCVQPKQNGLHGTTFFFGWNLICSPVPVQHLTISLWVEDKSRYFIRLSAHISSCAAYPTASKTSLCLGKCTGAAYSIPSFRCQQSCNERYFKVMKEYRPWTEF